MLGVIVLASSAMRILKKIVHISLTMEPGNERRDVLLFFDVKGETDEARCGDVMHRRVGAGGCAYGLLLGELPSNLSLS